MNILLSYHTQHLPPPYEYAIVISIDLDGELSIDFQMEYLGRDSLTSEEIAAEGFTDNDDVKWSGTLSNNWIESLANLSQLKYKSEPHSESYLHVQIDGTEKGFPADWESSDRLLQELVQAVFEASKTEKPLEVSLMIDNEITSLKWYFKDRILKVNNKTYSNWEKSQQVLNTIYSIDFETLIPSSKAKNQSINLGDNYWYTLNKNDWKTLSELVRSI